MLTREKVDEIHSVKETVAELIEYAEDNPDGVFDRSNLVILEQQLEALHQALSLAVAQKEGFDDGS